MSAPENPRAFPLAWGGEISPDEHGMSLRDYFAAGNAAAEIASAGANVDAARALSDAASDAGMTIPERIAFNAYEVADAMLAERAK